MAHLNVVGMDERGRPICKHGRLRHGCPECKAELTGTKRTQLWRAANPEKNHEVGIRQYGVDAEWYEQQHAVQKGLCAICGEPETQTRNGKVKRMAVDHDHETGEPRALLCCRCNQDLGVLENAEWKVKAEAYLASHRN